MSCFVPCCNGEERLLILTSLILVEYTTKMDVVDVLDQLCGNCSWHSKSHKWWHLVFLSLLKMTTINMYTIYLKILKILNKSIEAITHLEF